ncbi:uncharacterized protein [Salminus brasiliensis]|uniref:uncharacterized protein isoform X2 n=1 Tax=Salminus brasiliensis TaxID=930266 RepID=UPI003B832048
MRIESRTALLICLCLWIPTALSSYFVDDEGSGGDAEGSASGEGSEGSIPVVHPTEVATQSTTNMTKTASVTEAPVKVPEQAVTQLSSTVMHHADVESAGPTTKAPLIYTTKIPEPPPSPTSVKSFIDVKVILEVEATTIQHVDQETPNTPLDEKMPVLPVTTTSPKNAEEETTSTTSVVLGEVEDERTVADDVYDQSTDAPDLATTPLPLTTTSANDMAEPETTEASGETVESTTLPAISKDFITTTLISDTNRENDAQNPGDGDFDFDEVSPKTRANLPKSEVALGTSSEDGSLLERTEVLAGVIAGGLVGLAFAIMLVALMVYRMKKKDEGSYSLDEHKHPNGGYQRPVAQDEFLA